jgi:NLI interacting factor-like phosphatase
LEISKNFQLVIFSLLNERYCSQIIDLLDREGIVFDAFYQRLKAFKRTDDYVNYNQIYQDFDLTTNANEESDTPSMSETALQ